MGKITDALKKAAEERLAHIEKKNANIKRDFVVKRVGDSKIDPHVVTFFDPKSPISEQYKILRTNLQSIKSKTKAKVFVITSAINSEGKTITSLNLSIALAHDVNHKKILLVDADMRKGKITKYLNINTEAGLSELLSNGTALDSCLINFGVENLDLITAGSVPHNPAELLSSSKMKEIIETFRAKYDYIIFDAPPVIPLTDPQVLGAQADGVLMVVQAGRTQKGIIEHAQSLLNQAEAKVLGFILTGIRYHIPQYIYRYL